MIYVFVLGLVLLYSFISFTLRRFSPAILLVSGVVLIIYGNPGQSGVILLILGGLSLTIQIVRLDNKLNYGIKKRGG